MLNCSISENGVRPKNQDPQVVRTMKTHQKAYHVPITRYSTSFISASENRQILASRIAPENLIKSPSGRGRTDLNTGKVGKELKNKRLKYIRPRHEITVSSEFAKPPSRRSDPEKTKVRIKSQEHKHHCQSTTHQHIAGKNISSAKEVKPRCTKFYGIHQSRITTITSIELPSKQIPSARSPAVISRASVPPSNILINFRNKMPRSSKNKSAEQQASASARQQQKKRSNVSTASRSDYLNSTKVARKDMSNESEDDLLRDDEAEVTEAGDRTNVTPPTVYCVKSPTPVQSDTASKIHTSSPIDIKRNVGSDEFSISLEADEKSVVSNLHHNQEDREVSSLMANISIAIGDDRALRNFRIPKLIQETSNDLEKSTAGARSINTHTRPSYAETAASSLNSVSNRPDTTRFKPYESLSFSSRRTVHTQLKLNNFSGKPLKFKMTNGGSKTLNITATMSNQRISARPENKVSLWLTGYPAVESIISDSQKDALVKYLDDYIGSFAENCAAAGLEFHKPQFPLIQPKHGQLEIGCENARGVNFVLNAFGDGIDARGIGIDGEINVQKTLEVTNIAPTFLITAPGATTWLEVLSVCRESLRLPATRSWIKIKEIKMEKSNGQTNIRYVIIMPNNRELRDRLMEKPIPEEFFYPTAVRKAWSIRYQMTEAETGKHRPYSKAGSTNHPSLFKWPEETSRKDRNWSLHIRTPSVKQPETWFSATRQIYVVSWDCDRSRHPSSRMPTSPNESETTRKQWTNSQIELTGFLRSETHKLNSIELKTGKPSLKYNFSGIIFLLPLHTSQSSFHRHSLTHCICAIIELIKNNEIRIFSATYLLPLCPMRTQSITFSELFMACLSPLTIEHPNHKLVPSPSHAIEVYKSTWSTGSAKNEKPDATFTYKIICWNWRSILRLTTVKFGDGRGRLFYGN